MKKSRKKISSIIVALMMAFSITACGNQIQVTEDIRDDQDTEVTTEEVTEDGTVPPPTDGDGYDNPNGEGDGDATATDPETDTDNTETASADAVESGPIVLIKTYSKTIYDDDSYDVLYTCSYDTLVMAEGTDEAYPGVKLACDTYNSTAGVYSDWTEEDIKASAKEQKEAAPEYFGGYSDKSSAFISRLDDKIFSISTSFSSFYGGAHGMYGNGGYVFDAQTGEALSIEDVADIEELKTAAMEIFSRDYSQVAENEPTSVDALQSAFDNPDTLTWTMGPESLTLIFNPYEIASYAAGQQLLDIRYDDWQNVFINGYGSSDSDWALKTNQMMVDLNGDGALDYFAVNENTEYVEDYDYSFINGYTISAGSEELNVECYTYAMDTYLVKKDGHFYLYIVTLGDNDWHTLYMYALGDKITELGEMDGEFSGATNYQDYEYDEETGYNSVIEGKLYNPDYFYIRKRMDLISTFDAVRPCTINEKGEIVPLREGFAPAYDFVLTSKKELTFDTVDASGTITGSKTIPAGTEYSIYLTDDEKYVDMKLSDGTIVRVNVETGSWPHTINGEDLEELFDGIMFAG